MLINSVIFYGKVSNTFTAISDHLVHVFKLWRVLMLWSADHQRDSTIFYRFGLHAFLCVFCQSRELFFSFFNSKLLNNRSTLLRSKTCY